MKTRRALRGPTTASAILAACAVGLPGVPITSAQPTAELELSTGKPYVNEALVVAVRVTNAGDVKEPQFPDLPNCLIREVGSEKTFHSERDSSGRMVMVRQESYRFELRFSQAGEVQIPSIRVEADGKTLRTPPRTLTVRDLPRSASPRDHRRDTGTRDSDELLLADISCEQPKLYTGQEAEFTLTLWIKPAEIDGRPLSRSDMLQFITGQFGPFDTKNVRTSAAPLPLGGGPPETYYVVELPARFVVEQPGPLTFPDVMVGMNYPTHFSRDLFGDLRVTRHRRVPPVRPLINVPDVQPLPSEGRPKNFSGAVGRYRLSALAVPTNVRVGDPIQLLIDISGDRIETLPAPDLTAIPQMVENFRVPNETLAGTVRGSSKRFTQTIRAKRPDVKEIPPIEFAYFDPEEEEYVTARTEPIPLLVSVVEQLDAGDLTGIDASPEREKGAKLQARDGLLGNKTGEAELLAVVQPVTVTQVVLATLIPPAVFACIGGFAAFRRSGRDRAVQRSRRALRNAERRIQDAVNRKLSPREFHSEIEAALAGYLADRVDEPPARFLGRAAVTFLEQRGVDRELVERFGELVERCEQAAYAGGSDGDVSAAELATQCARRLERERL